MSSCLSVCPHTTWKTRIDSHQNSQRYILLINLFTLKLHLLNVLSMARCCISIVSVATDLAGYRSQISVSNYIHEVISISCNFLIFKMGVILLYDPFCVSLFEDFIFKVKDVTTYTLNMLPSDVSKVYCQLHIIC
jgi:hypothetical protein